MGSELRLYDVTVGTHKTRMRLNDADAKALGSDAALIAESPARTATPDPQPDPVETKSRLVTSNKMRGTDPGTPDRRGPH